jgi:hypothetical protein
VKIKLPALTSGKLAERKTWALSMTPFKEASMRKKAMAKAASAQKLYTGPRAGTADHSLQDRIKASPS